MHNINPITDRRIQVFSILGKAMIDGAGGISEGHAAIFSELITRNMDVNPWFTPENVRNAVMAIGRKLTTDNLLSWLSRYPELKGQVKPSDTGVVMAGNIPLVGFHDLLCVLVTGNRLIARLSSKDELSMRAVSDALIAIDPQISDYITLTTGQLSGFDKVIATGSDNTSRYFEYYFRNHPHIIRKNRNSVGIIDGTESDKELTLLANDVFDYFGLGCRSVSKLYLPEGYDLNRLTALWGSFDKLRTHEKYAANYDHNKAVMIVNRQQFADTGYLLLKEDSSLAPPMSVLNYEFYRSADWLDREIKTRKESIQCISGHGFVPFGETQHPELWEYADDTDTILFLLKKNAGG